MASPTGQGLLVTGAEQSIEPLQNLVELAAKLCGVPNGVINVVTSDEQRQVAAVGFEAAVCSRQDSMCAKVFLTSETTVVTDASLDPRFAPSGLMRSWTARI
ncbi:GAF domain-containing protein [Arthrobacter sp. SLBN-122]|uniref:GAF domain-containing protein n=1 Tax=Arthrobacter sp. SLBN-122 TaxID=2768455 RepID=UPI001F26FFEF|nr:GAF domain-containing protein [Arthrobacter sp. SLBN-122]